MTIDASWATAPLFYRAPHPPQMTPREFQLAGVEYHLARDHAIFGDEPGLGKSAQSIMLGNAIRAKRTLVVCPASLRLNWEREIWHWSTIRNVTCCPVFKARDGISTVHDYVILSYALLVNRDILKAILDSRWDHVILDEAHAIKDPKGNKRTHAICDRDKLPSVAGRMTLLTGTLLPNQPSECFNSCRLLNWNSIDRASLNDFMNTYYDFGTGFVRGPVYDPDKQAVVWKLHLSHQVRNVPKNLEDLNRRLRQHLMVRRLKKDVLSQLPPVQWHLFPIECSSELRKVVGHPGWLEAERLYELNPAAFDAGIPVDGAIARVRRLLGEAKVDAVAAYIKDLLEEVDKVVVGAWHTSVLGVLLEKLRKYGVVYMDGSTPAKKRQEAVDAFQTDPAARVILGQTIPLGEGWNLTAAQDVVLAEPDWVPGKNYQLVERVNRMGQEGSYTVGHVPFAANTLDERIISTAVHKDLSIHAALDKR